MKKRFLSLLLVLVLIMSLMPAALAVNADDAQPKTISVTFRLHTDTDEWIAPTEVSDLPEGLAALSEKQQRNALASLLSRLGLRCRLSPVP